MYKLYDYPRSSASFRVRIALNLKNQEYEIIPVHLLKDGGEQHQEAYTKINPQGLVPTFEDTTTNAVLTQSLAIIEYLDEAHPEPPLLPKLPLLKAKVRAFALAIACDMHPLNNLRVLQYLTGTLEISKEQKTTWYHHWLTAGFNPIEQCLSQEDRKGPFCFGENPTLADLCLIPQVYNALRFEFSLESYPFINEVYQHCLLHPAFDKAYPDKQPHVS